MAFLRICVKCNLEGEKMFFPTPSVPLESISGKEAMLTQMTKSYPGRSHGTPDRKEMSEAMSQEVKSEAMLQEVKCQNGGGSLWLLSITIPCAVKNGLRS